MMHESLAWPVCCVLTEQAYVSTQHAAKNIHALYGFLPLSEKPLGFVTQNFTHVLHLYSHVKMPKSMSLSVTKSLWRSGSFRHWPGRPRHTHSIDLPTHWLGAYPIFFWPTADLPSEKNRRRPCFNWRHEQQDASSVQLLYQYARNSLYSTKFLDVQNHDVLSRQKVGNFATVRVYQMPLIGLWCSYEQVCEIAR